MKKNNTPLSRTITRCAALVVLLCCNACLYSNITVPFDRDVEQTELGTRIGMASNHSVLWLVAWGDGGTEAAAANGNISVIRHMDIKQEVYAFGVYSKATTIVYGD